MENLPKTVEITSLSEITKSEIDIQIATAKKYPRSIQSFRQEALTMAIEDEKIAASCFYVLKRRTAGGGVSTIEGPSVRLAEIVASAWGNLRFGARIISETATEVIAQGVAHDLEKNVCNVIEVSRRITGKTGQRYNADMIQVTKNAACSIALRNAIFKTIPFTYAKEIYEQAKKTAVGKSETIAWKRQEIIKSIKQLGVNEDQIFKSVGKAGIEDLGLHEIEQLIGMFNAVRDGDSTVEEQFLGKNGPESPGVADPFARTPQNGQETATSAHKKPQATQEPGGGENKAILAIQSEIEIFLVSHKQQPSLMFKYSKDIYKKPLAELNLKEITALKEKIEADFK